MTWRRMVGERGFLGIRRSRYEMIPRPSMITLLVQIPLTTWKEQTTLEKEKENKSNRTRYIEDDDQDITSDDKEGVRPTINHLSPMCLMF